MADDDAVVRKALEIKLAAAGYRVFHASDGSEAVSIARREKPDVMILDINFPPEPGMAWDGFKLMQWIRRSPALERLPILVITGDTSDAPREKAALGGASGFFQKPIDMAQLIAAIDHLTTGTRQQPKS